MTISLSRIFALLLLTQCGDAVLFAKEKPKPNTREAPKQSIPKKYEAFAAVGVPHPYEIGFGRQLANERKLSVAGGFIERRFRAGKGFKDLKGSMAHIEMRYMAFPFPGDLPFWAVAVGYQELTVSGTKEIPVVTEAGSLAIDAEASIKVRSLYWTPQIGLSWRRDRSLNYTFATGIQIPFYVQADFDSRFTEDDFIDESLKSTNAYRELEGDIERLGEKFGKLAMPVLKLAEFGITF